MDGWPIPRRQEASELLDAPCLPPRALAGNLRDLGRANRYFGGLAVLRRQLLPALAAHPPDRPLRLLDVATGGADLPLALLAWASGEGRRLSIVGLDAGAQVLAYAQAQARGEPRLRLLRGDAAALPLAPRTFDYALCCLALHHLTPPAGIAALREMAAVVRHGLLVVDLERSWPAYLGTWLWSRACTTNHLSRHDGPLSVLRAYTLAELRALAACAGLAQARVSRGPFFRLVLWVTPEPDA
ncbi:MAG TPA: methyltransferase domain-containing protein [Chloroflexota bacterium]|nr:methyltransferase domain-containing protein [Chloroflexota bacterium]